MSEAPSGGRRFAVRRWAARLASLAAVGAFVLLAVLALRNEDRPQVQATVVLVLLGLEVLACAASWRWELPGGGLVMAGAFALGAAAGASASAFGLGTFAIAAAAIYALPFLLVGGLFVWSGWARR
jgi:hypothetical protein